MTFRQFALPLAPLIALGADVLCQALEPRRSKALARATFFRARSVNAQTVIAQAMAHSETVID